MDFTRRDEDVTIIKGSRSNAYIFTWFFLQIFGAQILMSILVATFLLSRARRHVSLVNFCACFIVSGICSSLLLYAGQVTGPPPNLTLCIFQAATANSLPPLWATALLMFVLHVRQTTKDVKASKSNNSSHSYLTIALPYGVFLAYMIAGCTLGALNPHSVTRESRVVYCDNGNNAFDIASASYCAVLAIVSLGLTAPILREVLRAYGPWVRKTQTTTSAHDLSIRLCVFFIFVIIAIIFSIWSNFNDVNASVRDIYVAMMPLAIFLVFGTQKDIFAAWCFWNRPSATRFKPDGSVQKRESTFVIDMPAYEERSPVSVNSDKYIGMGRAI